MKNDLNLVDTLGALLAKIADLEKQADAIKEELKDSATQPGASNAYVGNLFKATVVESNRKTVDWKSLAAYAGIEQSVIDKYTKVSAVFSVKVTSK